MNTKLLQLEFLQVMQRSRQTHPMAVAGSMPKAEFFVLGILHRHIELHPDAGGMYPSQLAAIMHVSPQAASRTFKALEGKGLIRREADPEDRRNTYIRITEEGQRLQSEAIERMQGFLGKVFEAMGEEDLTRLFALWNRLLDIMEREFDHFENGEATCSKS